MIIGADLLSELHMEINYNTQWIIWEGIEIHMKDKHIISNIQNATGIYYVKNNKRNSFVLYKNILSCFAVD